MIYDYHCGRCKRTYEVVKSLGQIEYRTPCEVCGQAMTKVFSWEGDVMPKPFEAHYNWGLGRVITKRQQIKDEMIRYNDTTGSHLYEVGNERQTQKPPRKKYTRD